MFMTVKEAAEKWGISDRRVRVLCTQGKIPGAYQEGRGWKIPVDAEKPVDGRFKSRDSLLAQIDRKKAELDGRRPLTEGELERLTEEFAVEYTYNSNAIEGNTLTLRETDLVLRGLTIDGVSSLKKIYTNDVNGKTEEILDIRERDGSEHEYRDLALTRYRCSLMTVFAMEQLMRKKPKNVGFIGTGRTNLANCIGICERFSPVGIVIRGSKRNVDKNIGDFLLVNGKTKVDDTEELSALPPQGGRK